MGDNCVLHALSAQQVSVDKADGDNILAEAFSAKRISVERATGDDTLFHSCSASKAGYDISGVPIAVPDIKTNIVRVK